MRIQRMVHELTKAYDIYKRYIEEAWERVHFHHSYGIKRTPVKMSMPVELRSVYKRYTFHVVSRGQFFLDLQSAFLCDVHSRHFTEN